MEDSSTHREGGTLEHLLLLALEGCITKDEFDRLQSIIVSTPDASEAYYEFLATYIGLTFFGIPEKCEIQETEGSEGLIDLLGLLANEEKIASPVEIRAEKPETDKILLNNSLVDIRPRTPVTGRQLFRFFSGAAMLVLACIAIIVLDYRLRQMADSYPHSVAMLQGQIDTVWDRSLEYPFRDGRMKEGRYRLTHGVAEVRFHKGAEVVIEGPAEWSLNDIDEMYLYSGSVYTTVTIEAIGFTLNVQGAAFVDLGTEFGVKSDVTGTSELHVTKGKIRLLCDGGEDSKISQTVGENQAVCYDVKSNQVEAILIEKNIFVRKFDSKTGMMWRGQMIDLADIVGGGNGFEDGRPHYGISLTNGRIGRPVNRKRQGNNLYHPVLENSFVDGVFVPDGGAGPVRISSTNHVYQECPDTNGMFYCDIASNETLSSEFGDSNLPLILEDQTYGTTENSAILMHANSGMTFDLDAIRDSLSDISIQRFKTVLRLSTKNPPERVDSTVDVAILVDGRLLFSRSQVTAQNGGIPITISLNPKDRFLTLVVTDGAAVSGIDASANDYAFFAEPILEIDK